MLLPIAFVDVPPQPIAGAGLEIPQGVERSSADRLTILEKELAELRAQLGAERSDRDRREQDLLREISRLDQVGVGSSNSDADAWYRRYTLGGYGEITYVDQAQTGSTLDVERVVLYLGYRLGENIQFHSEIEVEHGLVADEADGEVAVEQAYVDFGFSDRAGFRAGRFLTPLGILNRHHEPTAFHGVLRSDFDTFIIPSTWSADGIGVYGEIVEHVRGEIYIQSSLNGTGFDAIEGIRGGRQEQLAGFDHPALSGRIDWSPDIGQDAALRIGISALGGGIDNGPESADPGLDGDIRVYSVDSQLSLGRFDLKAQYAHVDIDGASEIANNVASRIEGWLVEGAVHILPDSWKEGRLDGSDASVFVRYESIDTQAGVPSGVTADPAGARRIWTFGADYLPTPNLVFKADFQVRDDDGEGLPERFALGLGWAF